MSFYCGPFKSSGYYTGQKKKRPDDTDFTVVVEDEEFHCHKFILSACSKFFDGLLRTEMRENLENRAVLKSMSKETFSVIMNAVYKGEKGLTVENIIPVWHATCFLDIPFLIGMCEYFVSQNLSLTNFESYYESATLLGSKYIVKRSHDFIMENFNKIKDTDIFHILPLDDMFNIIDSDKLQVNSEDDVIESILRWISYRYHYDDVLIDERNACVSTIIQSIEKCNEQNVHKELEALSISDSISTAVTCSTQEKKELKLIDNPETKFQEQLKTSLNSKSQKNILALSKESEVNLGEEFNRGSHLVKLFRSARMFLVSRGCLENLTRNSVITSNPDAMRIVYDALMYKHKAVNYRNVIVRYRECSNITNGVALVSKEGVIFHNPINDSIYVLFDKKSQKYQYPAFVGLAAIDSVVLYSTLRMERVKNDYCNSSSEKTFTYINLLNVRDGSFSQLGKFEGANKAFFLNYNNSFVRVDYSDTTLTVFQRNTEISFGLSLCVAGVIPTHGAVFEVDILIFYSAENKTGIKKCSPGDNKVAYLQIEGQAENMTSFQNGKYLYLLQNNGSVWLVKRSNSGDIEFTHLATLWHFELKLNGAVCYNKILYVYAEIVQIDQTCKNNFIRDLQTQSLPDVFDSIRVVEIKCQSQIVPMQIPLSKLAKFSIRYRHC